MLHASLPVPSQSSGPSAISGSALSPNQYAGLHEATDNNHGFAYNEHRKRKKDAGSSFKTKTKTKTKVKYNNIKLKKPATKQLSPQHSPTASSSSSSRNDSNSDSPPIHPPEHALAGDPSSTNTAQKKSASPPKAKQFEPGYKDWKGQHSIYCNGRIIGGPETKKQIRTLLLIIAPMAIYFSTTFR